MLLYMNMYIYYKLIYATVMQKIAKVRFPLGCTRMDKHKDAAEIAIEMTELS